MPAHSSLDVLAGQAIGKFWVVPFSLALIRVMRRIALIPA